MIEGHGDDLYRYGERIRHNFSSNIYTHVDHSELMRHLAGCDALLKVYPSPRPEPLIKRLAEREGVSGNDILVTAGTVEAMYLIAESKSGAVSAIVAPTFSEYADACIRANHTVEYTDLDHLPLVQADMVWICNPNNPDGRVLDRSELLDMVDSRPDILFVVDAAYSRYTTMTGVRGTDAAMRPNMIILRSLTKDFAVPGLRIGYMVMPQSAGINQDKLMPWRLNALAIESACWLLDHTDLYPIDAAGLHDEIVRIGIGLSKAGVKVSHSDCNFLLAELPYGLAKDLKHWLAMEHGILIRDASNFAGLGSRHFRVAAQRPEQNRLLTQCIRQWLNTC